MRKIAVFTGSRAEYGILKSILKAIEEREDLELHLIVTASHLLEKFGSTYKEIEKDGFKIAKKVQCTSEEDDSKSGMSKGIGKSLIGSVEALSEIKPDIALVPCDRSEMLGAAIAANYMDIPVAHIHGGEKSMTKDDSARHAITKFANIHFPSSASSAERIKKLGEEEKYIFTVGAAGLDSILNQELHSKERLKEELGIDLNERTILLVQHSLDSSEAKSQITETLAAIKELGIQTIAVYPNTDAGGRVIIEEIKKCENLPFLHSFKSLDHTKYLSTLKHSSLLLGNSSSGIIEAPSFKIPVVNIGDRQAGRERAANTIDVQPTKEEIIKGIKRAFDPEFKRHLNEMQNPYGNGTAGKQIAEILASIKITDDLIKKQIAY